MTKDVIVRATVLLLVLGHAAVAQTQGAVTNTPLPPAKAHESSGNIIRLDPALDAIVPPGSTVQKVYDSDRGITEGPVWTRDGALLFSDMEANVIYKLTPDGHATVFRRQSGYSGDPPRGTTLGSNGLTFDNQGRLIVCERGNRRVTRIEPDGRVTVLADRYGGRPLTRPNDVVVKSDGSIYFTDMCLDLSLIHI